MPKDTAQPLNVVSQESGERLAGLVRTLGELDYNVRLCTPGEAVAEAAPHPKLVYLGSSGWKREPLEWLKSGENDGSRLLALDQTAFGWAEPAIRKSRDFVTWPCPQSELKLRLERSCPCRLPGQPVDDTRQMRSAPLRALGLIGSAPAFLDSLLTLRRFAACDASVLVLGETGTGKELAARAIHMLSQRSEAPFVPVCCGALPDSLVEAELFGHARGAFTDAREARGGLVSEAEKGTLFLDEVEALSPKGQAALLRFLESLEYRRVGGSRTRKAHLRVIAAGNEDLHALARHGAFRSDLLYRLNVLSVTLPPLRARPGDANLLADHFLERFAETYQTGHLTLDAATRNWLVRHNWPGNVRELENLLHRAVVTASGTVLSMGTAETAEMPAHMDGPFGEAKRAAVDAFERDYLTRLMQEAGGNVTRAAEHAGKERRSLGKLLKKHGIDPTQFHLCEPEDTH